MKHRKDDYHSEPKRTTRIEFGEFLKAKRTEKGLSLRKLSVQCGLSASYVSYLERGIHGPPSIEVTEKLAEELGVNSDTMLTKAGHLHPDLVDILQELDDESKSAIRNTDPKGKWLAMLGLLALGFSMTSQSEPESQDIAEESSEELFGLLKEFLKSNDTGLEKESKYFQKVSEIMELWKIDLGSRKLPKHCKSD